MGLRGWRWMIELVLSGPTRSSGFTCFIFSAIGDFLLSKLEEFSIDEQGCEYYHELW
jgi:hypothetical protein